MLHRLPSTTARRLSSGDQSAEPGLDIDITEPALFLPTYPDRPAVLRGSCLLDVRDPLVVRRLTVSLRGTSRVRWSHGTFDNETVIDCTLTVFGTESSKTGPESYSVSSETEAWGSRGKEKATTAQAARRRLWNAVANKLYSGCSRDVPESKCKTFSPGLYRYNFEMVLHTKLPETIRIRGSNVRYSVRVCVERPGALKRNITRSKPIIAVHCPAEDFVEDAEPVYVRRGWPKLLQSEILISRRGAPLGYRLPVSLSFRELRKAQVRGIKVYLSENIQYLHKNGCPSCMGPYKKNLLYSAVDDQYAPVVSPVFTHRTGDNRPEDTITKHNLNVKGVICAEQEVHTIGTEATTLNFDLPLPVCRIHSAGDEAQNMHFDTKYKNVQVTHWLEFVFSLVKNAEADAPDKPKVQKMARTPLSLRPCEAEQANASLPAYSEMIRCDLPC